MMKFEWKNIKMFFLNLKDKINKWFKNLFKKNDKKDDNEEQSSFINDFVVAFVAFIIISTFFYQGFLIPSGSMKPQLIEGDCILVSKFIYGYTHYSFPLSLPIFKGRIFDFKKPQRGDVVVFRLPSNPKINYIKRLIGLPNDRIQVKNRILYVNGEALSREYFGEYDEIIEDGKNKFTRDMSIFEETINNKKIKVLQDMNNYISVANDTKEFIVPEGHYFFMGDNRDNSLDSRFAETGFIPYENIIGRAEIIFFSRRGNFLKFWQWHKMIKFRRMFKIIK